MISICIPAYEMNGKGIEYVNFLLQTIHMQLYKNIEVIISDHSKNEEIINYLKNSEWLKILNIKMFSFKEKYGNGPANTNNAIKYATGKYIKLMFQDDFFTADMSLKRMVEEMDINNRNWIAVGCIHSDVNGKLYDPNVINYCHTPKWNLCSNCKTFNMFDYLRSNSFLGAPSCIMYKRGVNIVFDENLVMHMDMDMYFQLAKIYGAPAIIGDNLLSVRIWDGNITNTKGKSVDCEKEKAYMIQKYEKNSNNHCRVGIY